MGSVIRTLPSFTGSTIRTLGGKEALTDKKIAKYSISKLERSINIPGNYLNI